MFLFFRVRFHCCRNIGAFFPYNQLVLLHWSVLCHVRSRQTRGTRCAGFLTNLSFDVLPYPERSAGGFLLMISLLPFPASWHRVRQCNHGLCCSRHRFLLVFVVCFCFFRFSHVFVMLVQQSERWFPFLHTYKGRGFYLLIIGSLCVGTGIVGIVVGVLACVNGATHLILSIWFAETLDHKEKRSFTMPRALLKKRYVCEFQFCCFCCSL